MVKGVLTIVGLAVALALAAPDLLVRLTESRAPVEVAAATPGDSPEPAADHGGIVRLRADSRGHYITEIEINNRLTTALVDTGATLVALRHEDAANLGLIDGGDGYDVRVRTANGEARARRIRIRSLRVGGITIHNVDAIAMEPTALGSNLLGMSFLKRLSRFEVQRGQLLLER